MSWYANAERRRAFKVERIVKRRNVIVLIGDTGALFESTAEKLAANGYREVKARPKYVNQGVTS